MPDNVVEWMMGIVASSNPKGVKLQGESEYHNWSKHGTPDESDRPVPSRGAKVRLGLDKDGFIRDMTDADKNPMGSKASALGTAGGGYQPMSQADLRRITLLSCLRSACALLAGVGVPLGDDGKPVRPATQLALQTARRWAEEIAPELFKAPIDGQVGK